MSPFLRSCVFETMRASLSPVICSFVAASRALSLSICFGATAKTCAIRRLTERKQKLRSILPKDSERLMYCDRVEPEGELLFRLVAITT
jgi:hypothetical protein